MWALYGGESQMVFSTLIVGAPLRASQKDSVSGGVVVIMGKVVGCTVDMFGTRVAGEP